MTDQEWEHREWVMDELTEAIRVRYGIEGRAAITAKFQDVRYILGKLSYENFEYFFRAVDAAFQKHEERE